MKILIVYGTIEGQTRKIARFMENTLQNNGHQVTIANAIDEPPVPKNYDAVLIGSSIHMHHYNKAITHYVKNHASELNEMPSAFFSVCLAIASGLEEEHKEAETIANNFLVQTGWNPLLTNHIAGALKYTQYDFFKRLIMKMIAKKEGGATDTSQDYEYTNWEEVKNFLNRFIEKAS